MLALDSRRGLMGPMANANSNFELPRQFQLKFEFMGDVNYRPTDGLASSHGPFEFHERDFLSSNHHTLPAVSLKCCSCRSEYYTAVSDRFVMLCCPLGVLQREVSHQLSL